MLLSILFFFCLAIQTSAAGDDAGLSKGDLSRDLTGATSITGELASPILDLDLVQSGKHDFNSERVFFTPLKTSQSLTLRATHAQGIPAGKVRIIPLVVAEPEGVTRHMTVTTGSEYTDSTGRLGITIMPGDVPGRYQVLFLQDPPPSTGQPYQKIEFIAQDGNWATLLILSLAGGLAIFLYGMKIASDGLQNLAGKRLRSALADVTKNQILGLLLGILITCFTQSSGATTVMLMSFVRAKLLSFRSSLGIVLGAAIGGTVTVQLISFNLFAYALPAVAAGFFFYFLSKRPRLQSIGLVALGFGLLFFGMKIMTDQMAPLKNFPFFRQVIDGLGDHPVWAVILSGLFTAGAQSSGATLGIVLALAHQDLISLHDAIPIFFGASIGGVCVTGLTGSIGAPAEAKRIAVAHVIFRICGVLLFLPMISLLERMGILLTTVLSDRTPGSGEFLVRAIANTYTLYITTTALIALPLIPFLEKLCNRLIRETPDPYGAELRTKYLDQAVLDSPSAALGSARREISRMGRFIEEMMKQIVVALFEKDTSVIDFIRQRDNKVDHLNTEITHYLTELTKKSSSEEVSRREVGMLYIVSDLESIGDIIDKNLIPLAQKLIANDVDFSEEGKNDLLTLHHKVSEHLSQMLIALSTGEEELAESIIDSFAAVQTEGKRFHLRHLRRLQNGLPESIETSSIHLDFINYLLRIHFLIFDISLHVVGKAEQPDMIEVVQQGLLRTTEESNPQKEMD